MIVDLQREREKRRVEDEVSPCCQTGRMSDAEFAIESERVESLIRGLVPIMGLGNYVVQVNLMAGQLDTPDGVMRVWSDWRYENATIDASIPMCHGESDQDLAYYVLHEGAHCHLAIVRPDDESDEHRNREEMAATRIGRMCVAYGQLCADQIRDQVRAEREAKDLEILDLKRQLKQGERKLARIEKERAA